MKSTYILLNLALSMLVNNLEAAAFRKISIWDHNEIRLCTIPLSKFMKHWNPENPSHLSNWTSSRSQFADLMKKVKDKTGKDLILEDSSTQIEAIKDIVTHSYSKKKTALTFVEWNECPFDIYFDGTIIGERKNYDAALIYFTLNQKVINQYLESTTETTSEKIHQAFQKFSTYMMIGGISEIGDISKTEPNRISVMSLNTPLDQQDILHEFGHLAGLIHEQERRDAYRKDPLRDDCNKKGEYPEIVRGGRWKNSELHRTSYDPYSIMNYCQNYRDSGAGLRNDSKLSLEDQKSLFQLYKSKPSHRKKPL